MNKQYWEEYYLQHGNDSEINDQSSFAEFCENHYFSHDRKLIIDIGSGNGRDSIFFSHCNHSVISIDQSISAISTEKKKMHKHAQFNLTAVIGDFVTYDYSVHQPVGAIYSRFSLHAINQAQEDLLMPRIYNELNNGGLFCVEARTINDPLFGIGKGIEKNAFMTDHYRRFIDTNEFVSKAIRLGFKLKYFLESDDLSVVGNDNPVLMRVVLEKI